ncbi:MAG: ribosomal protein S18-alanine N-acetyltransferase [Calditrichaceae bacterium]|nr:ribosomal protein S18-alanine N-acetyltransferase [Calditrichaceae bacterium]MBN2709524.1 ribosomal protein S18-alanine N-acetyltransferase [Calditrichaceae bacterium]RQV93132.1 MAG: ribosomal-protein-alanine N-acetyltransferase [Calditrichota bacterium]
MIIRPMTCMDIDDIWNLEKKIFKDPWRKEAFEYEVNNPKISYPCVIEKDSIILGYAVVWNFADETHIGNFAVHPDYRHQGLGKILMEHLLNKFSDSKTMYLEVRKSNQAAKLLYESFGFRNLYVREKYYSDGEDAIVMCKDLT